MTLKEFLDHLHNDPATSKYVYTYHLCGKYRTSPVDLTYGCSKHSQELEEYYDRDVQYYAIEILSGEWAIIYIILSCDINIIYTQQVAFDDENNKHITTLPTIYLPLVQLPKNDKYYNPNIRWTDRAEWQG